MARRQVQSPSTDFQLYIFKEDVKRIRNWVLQNPYLETGGSLFGLWTNSGNAVVRVVLGPATGCTRTEVSFYQDTEYLSRVGSLLTTQYMLCHIGEWHSHHCMSLSNPSSGDVSTVVRNYPRGASGFLLMIANIVSQREDPVKLSPYLFHEGSSQYRYGKIVALDGDSPFRSEERIRREIERGAESLDLHYPRREPGAMEKIVTKVKDVACFVVSPFISERGEETPMEIDQGNESPIIAQKSSPDKRQTRANRNRGERINTRSPDNSRKPMPRQSRFHQPTRAMRSSSPERFSQPAVEASKCTEKQQWYSKAKGEKLLGEIFNFISKIPHTEDMEMTRDTTSQDLSIGFKHHDTQWKIKFPSAFPKRDGFLMKDVSNTLTGESYPRHVSMISKSTVKEEAMLRAEITSNCDFCKRRKAVCR